MSLIHRHSNELQKDIDFLKELFDKYKDTFSHEERRKIGDFIQVLMHARQMKEIDEKQAEMLRKFICI
jgi:hypothetical protein